MRASITPVVPRGDTMMPKPGTRGLQIVGSEGVAEKRVPEASAVAA